MTFAIAALDCYFYGEKYMALFIDRNGEYYIGVLYFKNNEDYSGNFVKPSRNVVDFISRIVSIGIYILLVLVALCLFGRVWISFVGRSEIVGTLGLVSFAIACILAFLYLIALPITLSHSKRYYENIKLTCRRRVSREMYLFPLLFALLMIFGLMCQPNFSVSAVGATFLALYGLVLAVFLWGVIAYWGGT